MTLAATAASSAVNDSPELEALFESIVAAQQTPPATDNKSVAPAGDGSGSLVSQVGQLTRRLHETLRELGADKAIEDAAIAIPDTCERLSYVANMTNQAAHRTLTAIENTKPIQDQLERGATDLNAGWDKFYKEELSVEQFKLLVRDTRAYLTDVPNYTQSTHQQLNEIMMAQDFQDLTGQVIKRITQTAQDMQKQLLQLLIENVPAERREAAQSNGLLNGPVINGEGRTDVLTNQQQVDDLLQSLGF